MEAHASQVESIQRQSPQWALRAMPDMSVTARGCDAADVAAWDHAGAPSAAESPVFVVGFPRSGTTLLELALDAHPQLKSMDEQRFVQDALDELMAAGADYPQRLRDVSRESSGPRARQVLGARREEGEARSRASGWSTRTR